MTGSTTTPRAAVPQVPRIVKKLGAVGFLALALLFVRPCEMPGAAGSGSYRAAAGSRTARATFTVATLRAHELVGDPARTARYATTPSLGMPGAPAGRPL
jgi:hypothetical protein